MGLTVRKTKYKQASQLDLTDFGQFKVAAIGEGKCTLSSYNRRDFYKVTLVTKINSRLEYANRGITVNTPALVFANPLIPYSWTSETDELQSAGYFCVFTEEFIRADNGTNKMINSLLFKEGGEPVYFLNPRQVEYISGIFRHLRAEFDSEYLFKNDLIRNYIGLIFHETIKMQPASAFEILPKASGRITSLFLALLNRQFPVDIPRHPLKLKKARDFAIQLSVHVNYLNAAVQEVTGKATTVHINEKLVFEAKSLLINTNADVAEIAYGLGFEYASYFNNFFKKHTGITPLFFRKNS